MMRLNQFGFSAAGVLGLMAAVPAAQAIDFEAGDWTFSVNGNVNVHYVYSQCDDDVTTPSFGGALAGAAVGACNQNIIGEDSFSNVRTGLLPAALVFSVATQQNGWDIGATFGLYPGITTNDSIGGTGGAPNFPANNVALGTTQLDFRQVFLTVGNSEFGQIKAGRDFGIFGFDAIINDMTIPGVGVGSLAAQSPGNTTFGSIGFGYIYTDTLSQINYTTPSVGGFTITAGVFQPVDSLSSPSTVGRGEPQPGFHGQLRLAWETGFVSVNGVTLNVDGITDASTGDVNDEDVYGFDATFNNQFGPLGIHLTGYFTDGLGSVAYLFDSFDANGNKRESAGGLAQATLTFGDNKFGVNYGISTLDQGPADSDLLFEENEKITVGWYYSFTPNLTLVAEYSNAESRAHNGDDLVNNTGNVGAFFAF